MERYLINLYLDFIYSTPWFFTNKFLIDFTFPKKKGCLAVASFKIVRSKQLYKKRLMFVDNTQLQLQLQLNIFRSHQVLL